MASSDRWGGGGGGGGTIHLMEKEKAEFKGEGGLA